MSLAFAPPPIVSIAMRLLPAKERAALRSWLEWHLSVGRRLSHAYATDGARVMTLTTELIAEAERLASTTPALSTIARRHLIAPIEGWNLRFARPRPEEIAHFDAMLQQLAGIPVWVGACLLGAEAAASRAAAMALGRGLVHGRLLRTLDAEVARGRLPIPAESFARFRATPADLAERRLTKTLQDLLWFEAQRAREGLVEGRALLASLPTPGSRRFIGVLIEGESAALAALEKSGFDVFAGPREPTSWEAAKRVVTARSRPAPS